MKTDMNLIKKIRNILLYLFYLFIVTFVILETIFIILPVSDSYQSQPVNADNPILHFKPNRTVNTQIGFNFSHINKKIVNNYGYTNDFDFKNSNNAENKIFAIIGDSYVEASQVSNSNSFHGILNSSNKNIQFYPIGISGSPLSQYIAFAKFAENNFNPDLYIFLIIDNDFDESWLDFSNNVPGLHYFDTNENLIRTDYQPPRWKIILRKSAFIRYLYLDFKLHHQLTLFNKFKLKLLGKESIKEQGDYSKRLNLGLKATDMFLFYLNELIPNKPIILLVDGDRKSIYKNQEYRNTNKITNTWMEYINKRGELSNNIKVIDLHSYFLKDWSLNQKKFNWDYDYHWNERGHRIAAEVLNNLLD